MDKETLIDNRKDYIELIRRELLGPGSEYETPDLEHELISESPIKRYSVGVLFPKTSIIKVEGDETKEAESQGEVENELVISEQTGENIEAVLDEDTTNDDVSRVAITDIHDDDNGDSDTADEKINLAYQNKPSSFGMSFVVRSTNDEKDINSITCNVKFATYRKAKLQDCVIPIDELYFSSGLIHSAFSSYISYDAENKKIKLLGSLTKKEIGAIWENFADDFNSEDEYIKNQLYKLVNLLSNGYVREPHEEKVTIVFNGEEYTQLEDGIDETTLKISALKRKLDDGLISVTIMLFNDSNESIESPQNSIFQAVLSIDTADNEFLFNQRVNTEKYEQLSLEDQSTELLYRNVVNYGTGLGVSIDCSEIASNGNGVLKSDYFPSTEVPGVDFVLSKEYGIDDKAYSMKFLSDLDSTSKEQKLNVLSAIVDAYNEWVKELKARKEGIDSKYSLVAEKNIEGCLEACKRMRNGLDILSKNHNAWIAFSLANRAMYMQRVHLKLQTRPKESPYYADNLEVQKLLSELDYHTANQEYDDKFSWRPFQIGFLLMSIAGIVDETSHDRELVDLIWFPTGGGKTEAYLGLTAFTIFFRRLQYPKESDGTTVIMRYTLRLLTAQQFTRAATLICACERIRTEYDKRYPRYDLGDEEISIGLWIGGSHTPNKVDDAKKYLDKLKGDGSLANRLDRYNKFQMLKCPWCGASLIAREDKNGKKTCDWGYAITSKNKHFEFRCRNEECYFEMVDKLPIQIVDEELYNAPPTLLFATVDKFAMLPWQEKVGSFFATANDNRPPELIIQDELHLISGPLGTMVGLYETAIDYLCGKNGHKTKIVASTATIKKAVEQCSALYNRKVAQFPHPGLDYDDSFFSKEAEINHKKGIYGRTYIGILPSGKTKVMAEARIIAAMLQSISNMELSDEERDLFWSSVVYFNSIKDLGKCTSLLEDDVKDYIRNAAIRKNKRIRPVSRFEELTSRVSTTNLNSTMDTLEKIKYSSEDEKNSRPIDVVLATNMISVGIDIARLNAMLIVGQPKLTSEYIQASSRVGRSTPGVVFVLYDSSRSRDRSHFEQFDSYHKTFYKYVEPTTATPFSAPARERALHAVVISMMRHKHRELMKEESAVKFRIDDYRTTIDEIKELIISRQKQVNEVMNPGALDDGEEIATQIDGVFKEWESLATDELHDENKFCYGRKYIVSPPGVDSDEGRLLKTYNSEGNDRSLDTMTSMRSVDVMVKGKLLLWEEDNE